MTAEYTSFGKSMGVCSFFIILEGEILMKISIMEKEKFNDKVINGMYKEISNIILNNKNKMIYQINNTLVETNFMIGNVIVENEQNGNIRVEYGKEILVNLSKKLTNKFGIRF